MPLDVLGPLLPLVVGIALSPFAVAGVALVLAGRHATTAGPAYTAGWLLGLTAVTGLGAAVDLAGGDPARWTSGLRLVVGAALLGLAARKWRTRPRSGEPPATPSWMASIDAAGPGRAFLTGLLLSAGNPKVIAFAGAAGLSIGEAGLPRGQVTVAVTVFVVLSSLPTILAVGSRIALGERVAGPLGAVRDFMVANNNVILMVVFALLGATLIGDGLAGW